MKNSPSMNHHDLFFMNNKRGVTRVFFSCAQTNATIEQERERKKVKICAKKSDLH